MANSEDLGSTLIYKYSTILLKNGITEEIAKVTSATPDSLIGTHMRKLPNPNPRMDEAMGRLIHKEGVILTSVVEDMMELCSRKIGEEESLQLQELFPKIYHTDETNIVMENLLYQGYQMFNKIGLHNLYDAKLVLENLAKLHGISYGLIQEVGGKLTFLEKYPELSDPMFFPGADLMVSKMFGRPFSGVLQLLRKCSQIKSREAFRKLEKYDGHFPFTYLEILRAPNIIDVINHGDCWSNNILLSPGKNGDNPKIVFVDLQIARLTSPNVDIGFYLFSSCHPTVRKLWMELLIFYFDKFKELIENLGISCPILFQDFVNDFREKSKIGFLFGILMNVCREAIKNHNPSVSEGKIEHDFMRLFNIWIEEHPEKITEIVANVVEMLEDFELFGSV